MKPWEKYQAEPGPWAKYAPAEVAPEPSAIDRGIGAVKEYATRQAKNFANLQAGGLRGAASIGSTLLAPQDALETAIRNRLTGQEQPLLQQGQERRAALDPALQSMGADPSSLPYQAGKLGTEVGGTAGIGQAIAPIARGMPAIEAALKTSGMSAGGQTGLKALATRAIGGGVTGAASAGLINPEDAQTGGIIGAAVPVGAAVAGQAGRMAARPFVGSNAERSVLAQKAINQYGIPLGIADVSSNPFVRATRSVLTDAPIVGMASDAQQQGVREGYNRAIGQTFGADAPKLTPEVMKSAKAKLGAEFDDLWSRNVVPLDQGLAATIADISDTAAKAPRDDAQRLMSWLDDIQSKIVTDQAGNSFIPGEVANRLQSKLGGQVEASSGILKNDLSRLHKGLLGAFNRNVSPEDAARLSTARGQYKAYKTIEPLMQGAEAGQAGRARGDVPESLVPGAVVRQYRGGIAESPFADLSQIGSQFVAGRVPQTGGSPRAMIQNGALGTLFGLGAWNNPLTLAALPVGYGVNRALGSPQVAQRMLSGVAAEPLPQVGYQVAPQLLSGL